ncbi:MAG: hypothetical protein CMB57_02680 [Euryarchaeota archaeon]|nr:hypothetical protein [Euryarchaeota archaeon]
MRVFAFIVVLLMLPLASAISDLSIYSEAEFSSQDEAPILVEWFHGVDDESQVEDLRKLDRDGEITLLHWRTGADNEGGNLPSDDADARHMYHSFLTTPAVAVDGYPENISDFEPEVRQNEVSIDWTIQLIGSSEVELLNITATWTNPKELNGATQMHIFIIETNAIDDMGREVPNLVRDWSPSSSLNFAANGTNHWNETITRDHLVGAGVELGDASFADKYEVMLILIGGFEDEKTNRVLSIQREQMPTYWQSVDQGAILTPAILLLVLIVLIGFIVMAERKREIGLPRLEGSWSKEENVIEYRIITGYQVEIGDLTMGDGWRANGRIKKQTIAAYTTHTGTLRVTGNGKLSLKLAVKVDELGDWILDLNLPNPRSND